MKIVNQNKRSKLKNVVKTALMLIVFAISYVISAVTSSVYLTNIKLITLLICFVLGALIFFIIYGVLYLIAIIKISKKTKRLISNEISCDDRAVNYFKSIDYKFNYDVKKKFSENLLSFKLDVVKIVQDVAQTYGNHDKYYYLGYTIYDALGVLDNAVDLLDAKISPIFKFLKVDDKPLKSVELTLEKAIELGAEGRENLVENKGGFLKKAGEKLAKVTVYVFRTKIENLMVDVVKFIGFKAFEVYSKSGSQYEPEECGVNLK